MITEHYKPIITPDDIRRLARPCDVDREIAERAIEEATLLDIKPKLGEALFVDVSEGDLPAMVEAAGDDAAVVEDGGVCPERVAGAVNDLLRIARA